MYEIHLAITIFQAIRKRNLFTKKPLLIKSCGFYNRVDTYNYVFTRVPETKIGVHYFHGKGSRSDNNGILHRIQKIANTTSIPCFMKLRWMGKKMYDYDTICFIQT